MREQFEIPEKYAKRLDSIARVPVIAVGGIPYDHQKNANYVWQEMGKELGFDWRTVRPVKGLTFTADPTP